MAGKRVEQEPASSEKKPESATMISQFQVQFSGGAGLGISSLKLIIEQIQTPYWTINFPKKISS